MKLDKFLKWRSVWMAAAILMIIIYHSGLGTQEMKLFPLGALRRYGYGGVDIFMFASGIGCYASYTRDRNFGRFLKKRALRILPAYWIVLIVWMLVKVLLCGEKLYVSQIVGNIFCVQNFTGNGNDFNWYISAIWLFYLLTPLFVLLADWTGNAAMASGEPDRTRRAVRKREVLLLLVSLLFTVSFWNSSTYIVTITRIPVFLLGMLVMKRFQESEGSGIVITRRQMLAMLGLMAAGCAVLAFGYHRYLDYMWYKGFYWYPFLLIAPALCLIISLIAEGLEKTAAGRWILNRMNSLGKVTFEIFMTHITLYYALQHFIDTGRVPGGVPEDLLWAAAIVLAVAAAYPVRLAAGAAVRVLQKTPLCRTATSSLHRD
ncbi:MAG: acyltransferase [Lachnospiraceae bacterium]|nr:acyltransferase [Lachnospiraceae bacterium]